MLPERVEDYVGAENAVQAIEAFVDSLDLQTAGFRKQRAGGGRGVRLTIPAIC